MKTISINSMYSLVENHPEKVRFSMLGQARDAISPSCEDRINYLKEQFNNILDNLVPTEVIVSYILFDKVTIDKFIKIQKRNQHKFYEFSKDPYLKIASKFKYSDSLLEFLENNGKEVSQRQNKVRRLARKLIYLRNNILKALKELGGEKFKQK